MRFAVPDEVKIGACGHASPGLRDRQRSERRIMVRYITSRLSLVYSRVFRICGRYRNVTCLGTSERIVHSFECHTCRSPDISPELTNVGLS